MNREFPKPKRETVWFSERKTGEVIVFDGEHYRRQNDGPGGTPLESFDPKKNAIVGRLSGHACQPGDYPWDHWQKWALEDGVDADLAGLGRDLIREADQHGWNELLRKECGWSDSGKAMIELALQKPDEARKRWERLMKTDGERGFIDDDGEWQPL